MPFTPDTKTSGDIIRSADWNDAMNEIVRLDNEKANLAGDTFTGDLRVNARLSVGGAAPDRPLTIQGAGTDLSVLSLKNAAGSTVWHVNMNVLGTRPGLNFAETGVADGRLFIQPGGNVGINTTDPVSTFHFNGRFGTGGGAHFNVVSNFSYFSVGRGNNLDDDRLRIGVNNAFTGFSYANAGTSSSIRFSITNRDRSGNGANSSSGTLMTIARSNTHTGRVGILTTSPQYTLDVNGIINTNNDIRASRLVDVNNTTRYVNPSSTSLVERIHGRTSSAITCVRGQNDGTGYSFYSVHTNSARRYGQGSSIRFKDNIRQIEGALDKILSIRGVYFNWKKDGAHDLGFIAEEVGDYIPEIVAYEPDGVYTSGMNYSAITPMLVEAIKEQQKQIQALQEQLLAIVQK
ncbi:MAG: tail fiber domain-containing protein [Bacteroidota bacterium]